MGETGCERERGEEKEEEDKMKGTDGEEAVDRDGEKRKRREGGEDSESLYY